MDFKPKFFDPTKVPDEPAGTTRTAAEDKRPVYVYTDEIVLAVNVALAADRPLLITGPPGSGKSTLARHIAEVKDWGYLAEVTTSRTQAVDLLGRYDTVRRLNDATGDDELLPDQAYLEPGVLWWAFDPKDAARRGFDTETLEGFDDEVRERIELDPSPSQDKQGVVVLLDEIDKAEPDVPNDLLAPLDQTSFRVSHKRTPVTRTREVFLILTTNGERELPPAFMRRCVVLNLGEVTWPWLVTVARRHFGGDHEELYEPLARRSVALGRAAEDRGLRPTSTAEYLNAIVACARLGIPPEAARSKGGRAWAQADRVLRSAMWKHEVDMPDGEDLATAADALPADGADAGGGGAPVA